MTVDEWNKIVIHQVNMLLSERGLSLADFNLREQAEKKYEMSLKLLEELG